MYISRLIEQEVTRSLQYFPVVAITGPRQCGKSTLVKFLSAGADNVIHLDMERPSDLRKLDDAEWFLSAMRGKRICIDEIQRKPELFPVIRTLTDEWDTPGAFIITGSASRDLLRQTSETLAGRIAYKRLTPFLWDEIAGRFAMEQYLAAGGFPRSLLAPDPALSMEWRLNYISTFLERDLLQWVGFTPNTMLRLWRMLAHLNGQTVNYASLAKSLDISAVSVKH
jgi:predicted AAA+ superfamily ATPase